MKFKFSDLSFECGCLKTFEHSTYIFKDIVISIYHYLKSGTYVLDCYTVGKRDINSWIVKCDTHYDVEKYINNLINEKE